MAYEFRLPDIGEGVAEGEVVKWFVREGDTIQEDAPLVSVLTDKANVEIPSPKAGRILRLYAQEGEKVKVGAPLVTIETGAGSAAAPAPPAPPEPEPREREAPPAPGSSSLPSPASGPGPSAPEPSTAGPARILATPWVRRLATERGVDLTTVRGTGPGGRILEADLSAGFERTAEAASRPSPSLAVPLPATGRAAPADEERVPIRGVRRVIAEHMAEAVHRAAHFTYVEEVDVGELVHLRDRMAKHIEKDGLKLSYLPFIVKAVIQGLRKQPRMNATMDDERQELVLHRSYHIGIATAAPEGLVVPVVHDADRKPLAAIAREIAELAEKARSGKITRPELLGGTFTITSLGALGGLLATPILNYPQVAILGVHRIARRPVYRDDGTLGPGQLMNLSVSLDHRVLDGIVGAQFLAVVKSYLEDPHQLFAELA